MTAGPEISLLVSSYNRAEHLRRALLSIASQKGVEGKIEVVVTDDGSTDHSHDVVRRYRNSVSFPVAMTTHPHASFQLARCRNEGVAASKAPYLLFLDGDCVLPPDHVSQHLAARKKNVVMAGDCARLDQAASTAINDEQIRCGDFARFTPQKELARLRSQHRKAQFYSFIRHSAKPKLIGNNVAIWRADYERVNGYDENFVGWGCEDDDLRLRLRRAGVRIESILGRTFTYHLWHATDPTATANWRDGPNVGRLQRPGRLTACRWGLKKKELGDLRIRVVGEPLQVAAAKSVLRRLPMASESRADIEIVVSPGSGKFTGAAECNVLVITDPAQASSRLLRKAHVVVGTNKPILRNQLAFDFAPVDEILRKVA
jgi:GT2 family glycosyltransferase